jgi:serine phosphatase RsbU (regulator of sigma subunit)
MRYVVFTFLVLFQMHQLAIGQGGHIQYASSRNNITASIDNHASSISNPYNGNKELHTKGLNSNQEMQQSRSRSLRNAYQTNQNILFWALLLGFGAMVGVIILGNLNRGKKKKLKELSSTHFKVQDANITLELALKEIGLKNKQIIDSINYANYIQRAALPDLEHLDTSPFSLHLFFSAKDIVSGDFYFAYSYSNRFVFGIGDCTGHGVPGAMVSLVGMNSIEKVVRDTSGNDTTSMVTAINHAMGQSLDRGNESLHDGMDLSFCLFDKNTKQFAFSGANHDAYLIRETSQSTLNPETAPDGLSFIEGTENHHLFRLKGVRRPVGKTYSTKSFESIECLLQPCDRILLTSDGYFDQLGGERDKKLKKAGLYERILASASLTPEEQKAFLAAEFTDWKGKNEQVDDVCLLIASYNP